MSRLTEMQQEMARIVQKLEGLHSEAAKESRAFTESEQAAWEKLAEDHRRVADLIEREQFIEGEQSRLAGIEPRQTVTQPGQSERADAAQRYRDAFWRYLKRGKDARVPQDVLETLSRGILDAEGRSLVTNTDISGGYTVPEGSMQPMVEADKFVGGVTSAPRVTIMTTPDGSDLPVPMIDDTAQTGEAAEEVTAATIDTALTFQRNTLRAYLRDSNYVKVSYKFLRDTSISFFETWLLSTLGKRLYRRRNEEFTNGTGNNEPQGVAYAATSGVTAASATEVTYDELLQLYISVDRAYRQNAAWMMNDTTYGEILSLVDGNGRHYFIDQTSNPAESILRKPIVINPDMPNTSSGLKAVLFGDFSYYWVRIVGGPRLSRSDERFWDEQAAAFMAVEEYDGMLMDAGQHPIKAITMA